MAITIDRKYLYFRWQGATLALNPANMPWLSNVLKLTGLTTPNSSGLNARSNYTGSYGGTTAGGTLQQLVQGQDYELISGALNWSLPTAVQVYNLVASGLTQLPAPASPQAVPLSSAPTTALNVTASSVANATGYQLYSSATQTGTYAKLGGVLSTPAYSHTGLTAGQQVWYEWQAIGDGTTYASSPLGGAFSGTTSGQAGALITYAIPETAWTDTAPASAYGQQNGQTLRSSRANVSGQLPAGATSLEIHYIGDESQIGYPQETLGVWLNGIFQSLAVTGDGTQRTATVANLPGTVCDVQLAVPVLVRNGHGTQGLVGLSAFEYRSDRQISWATPTAPTKRIVFLGMSITGGSSASEPYNEGYTLRLRKSLAASGTRVSLDTVAGASLAELVGSQLEATCQRLSAMLDGTQANTLSIAGFAVNDLELLNRSASDYQADLASLVARMHQLRPNVPIVLETPTGVRAGYHSGAGNAALDPFRAATRQVASDNASFCRLFESERGGQVADLVDDVHGGTAWHLAHFQVYSYWLANNAYPSTEVTFNSTNTAVNGASSDSAFTAQGLTIYNTTPYSETHYTATKAYVQIFGIFDPANGSARMAITQADGSNAVGQNADEGSSSAGKQVLVKFPTTPGVGYILYLQKPSSDGKPAVFVSYQEVDS